MAYQNTAEQDELLNLASGNKWDLLVTLTFSSTRTQEQVTKALKAYFVSIDRSCLGKGARYTCIKRLPVIEHTAEATHVHIVIVKPARWSNQDFRQLLSTKWLKIRGAGKSNLQKMNRDKSWYEPIGDTDTDRRNVIGYITKYVSKDFSSVDIENIRI